MFSCIGAGKLFQSVICNLYIDEILRKIKGFELQVSSI